MKKQTELVAVYDLIDGNKLSVIKTFCQTTVNNFNNGFQQQVWINDELAEIRSQGSITKTFEEWKSLIETNLNFVKRIHDYKFAGNNPINRATRFIFKETK